MIIPAVFRKVPEWLAPASAPAGHDELALAEQIRRRFLMPGEPAPYMADVVRAFRLIAGGDVYIELGTRDKGNLAWVSSILAKDALIVDIDSQAYPVQEKKLAEFVTGRARIMAHIGESTAAKTLQWLHDTLAGRRARGVFLDSDHRYENVLAEIELYMNILADDGILLIHDAHWEGSEAWKGKAQALAAFDRHVPVYVVFMNEPVHRFLLRQTNQETWGSVAIISKHDYLAAMNR